MLGGIGATIGGFGMPGVWAPLFLGMVLLLAFLLREMIETLRREERPVFVAGATFEDALRGRLERGEISDHDFEHTMRQLRDS